MCPWKKREIWVQRHWEDDRVKVEAEMGVMHLQAPECQGLLATTTGQKEVRKALAPEPSGERGPADFRLPASRTMENKFLLF